MKEDTETGRYGDTGTFPNTSPCLRVSPSPRLLFHRLLFILHPSSFILHVFLAF